MMLLTDLINRIEAHKVIGSPKVRIKGLTYDSRRVVPGDLFICLPGAKVDGHDFAQQALEHGAVAIIAERELPLGDITQIIVSDSRKTMAKLSAIFYNYPSNRLRLIGITGTNGKTTTTYLIKAILEEAGYGVGLIGTIQSLIGQRVIPVKNTTPESLDLQNLLHQMSEEKLDYAVMEVSSHALSIGRVAGCEYDTAIFTNLTTDHLDFHASFENYAAAKAKLFAGLGKDAQKQGPKTAVINLDDPYGTFMAGQTTERVLTYGIQQGSAIQAKNVQVTARGTSFIAATPHGEIPLQLKITGMFNVYNTMAAIGAGLAEGIAPEIMKRALEKFTSVAGRFELVEGGQDFAVVVDYAHTPDGLENILQTAKEFARGKIILVFGCGGDRDRTKRPMMGALAAQYADFTVVTSDNPRSEEPFSIMEEIERGLCEAGARVDQYVMISDRKDAIREAITLAQPDDIVLIAGKGHETYQILKERTIPFDDREVARTILKEMKA
jgi:UDP-N-acetylmuramyl-tripeptide synthetase